MQLAFVRIGIGQLGIPADWRRKLSIEAHRPHAAKPKNLDTRRTAVQDRSDARTTTLEFY